jgi:hypothetical protein
MLEVWFKSVKRIKYIQAKDSQIMQKILQDTAACSSPIRADSSLFSSPIFFLISSMFSFSMFPDSLQILCHVMWDVLSFISLY